MDLQVWAAAMDWMDGWTAALYGTAQAMADGTWWSQTEERHMESDTGLVFQKFAQLRAEVGVLKAKKKDGVKFKVRSADELADRIRPEAERLGLLIYPIGAEGKGHVVENGTLAEVTITLRIRAVEDGSYFDIQGFGLGADNQDKAGGKAGTYAWKVALVQALTAGGEKDTDDTDTPIKGGVKPAARKGPPPGVPMATKEEVEALIIAAEHSMDMSMLKRALSLAGTLDDGAQAELAPKIRAASAVIRGA